LKELRINREREEEIMANVPGWEVGKLGGEKIYKTVDDDTLVMPRMNEFYVTRTDLALELRKFDHWYNY